MIATHARAACVALGVAMVLAACQGSSGVAPDAPKAMSALNQFPTGLHGVALKENPSPCAIPGAWYFHGSCRTFYMNRDGSGVTLTAYKGLTLLQHYGRNSAQPHDAYATGDGTSDKDIARKDGGAIFPLYGTTKCVNQVFQYTPCVGKAFSYSFLQNRSTTTLLLTATPKLRITNTNPYPGRTCTFANLGYTANQWLWMIIPVTGRPRNGVLTLQPWPSAPTLDPGHFFVFAYACYN